MEAARYRAEIRQRLGQDGSQPRAAPDGFVAFDEGALIGADVELYGLGVTAHRMGGGLAGVPYPTTERQAEYVAEIKAGNATIYVRESYLDDSGEIQLGDSVYEYKIKGPGYEFDSIEDAAQDGIAASYWLRENMGDNFERGGDIVRLPSGKFTYDSIDTGARDSRGRLDFNNESAVSFGVNRDATVAWFHIHTPDNPANASSLLQSNDRANLTFSRGDIDEAAIIKREFGRELPAFLGTSGGGIVRSDHLSVGSRGTTVVQPNRWFTPSPYRGGR